MSGDGPGPTPIQPPPRYPASGFTHRHRAILRAIDTGRAEVLWGCVPTLLIDGLFCDQTAANDLFRARLICGEPAPAGHRGIAKINHEAGAPYGIGPQPAGEQLTDHTTTARASHGEQR
ncbi:hypothetical protein PSU4_46170 [Pseudonocardia sulfidoxydans NBRC 16205]|uniref:Uncharacterized protein n=1 Tax=Pseudonocardia sulfidoxydans NBRC 16205 TaxID=1223511 RepID=A0A511DN22_9PSEU|nr:hypothetical protein PSU4_46170 [Pseudonocardia sulfidoxydans NBRC 16205]